MKESRLITVQSEQAGPKWVKLTALIITKQLRRHQTEAGGWGVG